MQGIEKFWGSCLGKRQSRATIWRQFLRPVGSKRQSRALNSMFCYKMPERAPDSEPPPVSWLVVRCKDRNNISHIQMFCEQIYSLITPSLLPHCGVGQKVTQPSTSDHITGLSLYTLICRSAKVIKDIIQVSHVGSYQEFLLRQATKVERSEVNRLSACGVKGRMFFQQ